MHSGYPGSSSTLAVANMLEVESELSSSLPVVKESSVCLLQEGICKHVVRKHLYNYVLSMQFHWGRNVC